MKPLTKFLNLTRGERNLLASAVYYLAAIRIAFSVLPFQQLVKRLETLKVSETHRHASRQGRHLRVWKPEQISWAIRVVGRYLPGTGNCLVQSLAAQTMLARRGYSSHLRIGVAKDKVGKFNAHAWVECDGKIVIGGAGASQYTAFPPLEVQCR